MSYKKVKKFVYQLRFLQEQDLDVLAICSSPKGFGKSSFIIICSLEYMKRFGLICFDCRHEWVYTGVIMSKIKNKDTENEYAVRRSENEVDLFCSELTQHAKVCPKCQSANIRKTKRFNFMNYLAYDNEEVMKMVYTNEPYTPLLADEGVRFMMAEDWGRSESKDMKKLFAQMRTKHLVVFTNIPKFTWLDRKYKDDMASCWIRILKREIALLMFPDLSEVPDTWHFKELMKMMGSYNIFTRESDIIKIAEKIKNKHPCGFDWFRFPKVPDTIYKDYLIARDKKAFENKLEKNKVIDQKIVGKVILYNLYTNWHDIKLTTDKINMRKGKFILPKDYIANLLCKNPQTGEILLSAAGIQKWIKEIKDKIVQKEEDKILLEKARQRKEQQELNDL